MFTTPSDNGEVSSTERGEVFASSKLVTKFSVQNTTRASNKDSPNTPDGTSVYISDSPPILAPLSPTIGAFSIEAELDVSDTESWTTILTSECSSGDDLEPEEHHSSRPTTPAVNPGSTSHTLQDDAVDTIGLRSNEPIHRPNITDTGRVRRLRRAHDLNVRTQGLESYYPFSRVFQPGAFIGDTLDGRPRIGHLIGHSCLEGFPSMMEECTEASMVSYFVYLLCMEPRIMHLR
ncbi:hypothetical protein OPT61_g7573 [Boeremia exigua]|uniref:Uncharacterized protein n=1 Tax=Boeremia exigua TaxID=749465 RepID=A0ACC2I2V0_9PLEO|nr:hypothetical protein OPT61_g7573 [Boeremia exigua]